MPKSIQRYFLKYWPFLILVLVTIAAFWPFFVQGKIPLAGDILLGQYYPWLDSRWGGYSTIFPVLNNTIADSIFSFYPWKLKAIQMLQQGMFPLYEPNTYMGNQLFASGTTGLLYPLNIFLLIFNFNFGWGLISSSTVFLSGSFFYIWLRNKGLEKLPVLAISIAYAFSAFIGLQVTFINTSHSVLWLPLILFTIDKLTQKKNSWYFVLLIFSLYSSLNAGFFQGSLYVFVASFAYFLFTAWSNKRISGWVYIILGYSFSILLSAIQILPFIDATTKSSRLAHYGSSALNSEIVDFFVKAKFFITTIIPDFFGNPGKGNYFGDFGYYEFNNFCGTIAIIGLIFGLQQVRKHKEVLFFLLLLIVSVIFASANFISRIPYELSLPIISSLIPARLLVLTQFSLLVIAAYGLNYLYQQKISLKKYVFWIVLLFILYLGILVITYLQSQKIIDLFMLDGFRWQISFRNSLIPLAVLSALSVLLFLYIKLKKRTFFVLLIIISSFELIRQTSYFRPFISPQLIYPKTQTTDFLEKNLNGGRFMITNQDLIPTNSQLIYNFKIVDGEGPIYPKKYGDLIASINFPGDLKTEVPQYRRMVYFRNTKTSLLGLLNIKYVISMDDLKDPSLNLVFQEGRTKVFENTNMLPRVWLTNKSIISKNPVEDLKTLQSFDFDPQETVIISDSDVSTLELHSERSVIENYQTQNASISFNTRGPGQNIVVLSEQYYPEWKLYIDGQESQAFPVDYDLLGFYLPRGEHEIELKFKMSAFDVGKIISLSSLFVLLILMVAIKIKMFSPKKSARV